MSESRIIYEFPITNRIRSFLRFEYLIDKIERVGGRSGLSPAETLAIIEKQAPRGQRLAAADIVIDNSDGEDALKRRLTALHETLIRTAASEKA